MSSPGIYWSMSDFAKAGMMAYLEMADLDSGTRVKILPELKSRSLNSMSSRMPCLDDRAAV